MHSSFVSGGNAVPIYFLHSGNSDAVIGGLSAKARAFVAAASFEAKPGKLLLTCGDDGALGAVLFGLEAPKVRVVIRAKGKPISTPVSASYGFEDATGDVQLQGSGENSREVAANTVTLMISEEPGQKTVGVFLLDATTEALL